MLRQAIDIALGAHLKPIGYHLELGNATFTQDTFTVKLIINREKAPGEVEDQYAREWARHHPNGHNMQGVKPGMVTKPLGFRGTLFKLRGMKPRARKNRFVMENMTTGKLYRFNIIANYQFVEDGPSFNDASF